MDMPDVEDLIRKAMRHGWRVACEVPLVQFGDPADLRPADFLDYLAGLARDGLHIDYEANGGFFMRIPADRIVMDGVPGKITHGVSHRLNPRVIRLTFSRLSEMEMASASRAA